MRRFIAVNLALLMALVIFLGLSRTADAVDYLPDVMYFPWVPNGEVINDSRGFGSSGPYFGTLTIQNLEDEEIEVFYEVTATGSIGSTTLAAHASTTLTTDDLFAGDPGINGSGVIAWGQTTSGEVAVPARIAGVQKQAAPTDLTASASTSGDHETVAGYTGLAGADLDVYAVLPIVQTNSNWNTIIRVTNFNDDKTIDMTLQLNPAGGGATASVDLTGVGPGSTETVDLLSLGLASDWVGSAIVTVEGSPANIGAVAERVKNETSMLMMNTSQLLPAVDNTKHAPLVFSNFNFWNTGIAIASLSESDPVDLTITYYDPDGVQIGDPENLTIPPHGMDFVYTPAQPGSSEEGFVGTAIVEADGPIAGAVDEVKYFGEDLDTGHAMSYMLEEIDTERGESQVIPLIQKGHVDDEDILHGDTSGVRIFNPSSADALFSAIILDRDGDVHFNNTGVLGARESITGYMPDVEGLAEGFTGSIVIVGPVLAVSNNVNYDVAFDGSASFSPVQTGELTIDTGDDGLVVLR